MEIFYCLHNCYNSVVKLKMCLFCNMNVFGLSLLRAEKKGLVRIFDFIVNYFVNYLGLKNHNRVCFIHVLSGKVLHLQRFLLI